MQVRFLQNLGREDAEACNKAFGCRIDHTKCVIDAVVDVPDKAAEFLGIKYKALFEAVGIVKGVAKSPAITAPAKE